MLIKYYFGNKFERENNIIYNHIVGMHPNLSLCTCGCQKKITFPLDKRFFRMYICATI